MMKDGAVDIDALNPTYAGELGAGRIDASAVMQRVQEFALPAGLSLISFGMNLSTQTDTPEEIFGTSAVTVYAWDPTVSPAGDYRVYPDAAVQWFQPGAGCWVSLDNAGMARLEGTFVAQDQPAEIPLRAGWNLIGTAFLAAIPWDTDAIQVQTTSTKTLAAAAQAGEVYDYAWAYDQTLGPVPVTTVALGGALNELEFHRGYWLYAAQDATLILPPPQAVAALRASRSGGVPAWSLSLVASTSRGRATTIVGAVEQGQGEIALLAAPTMAEQPSARLLAFDAPGQQRAIPACAVHLPPVGSPSQAVRWDLEIAAPTGEEVRLLWPDLNGLPRTLEASLQDVETGAVTRLRNAASYQFTADDTPRRFRVTVTPTFLGGLVLQLPPPQSTRSGAYQFTVVASTSCRLSLEVLTLSGEVVGYPCSEAAAPAGVSSYVWLARSATGAALPPGPYLLRGRAEAESGQVANAVRVFHLQ